jgi:hypothetical protein
MFSYSLLLFSGREPLFTSIFYPDAEDDDKVRGRGVYFTADEWKRIFGHLCGSYRVEFVRPGG